MKYFSLIIKILMMFCLLICNCNNLSVNQQIKGRILFLSGDANLNRNGNNLSLSVGFQIETGDIISTGNNSTIVIQIFEKNIIRISQNSKLEFKTINNSDHLKLYLEQGEISSKVQHLIKYESFNVNTPTMTASVRGTTFCVKMDKKQEKVVVLEGKVLVESISDQADKSFNSTQIDSGNTAVLDIVEQKPKLSIRAIDNDERIIIEKVNHVRFVPNINKINADEMKNITEEIKKIESNTEFYETSGKLEQKKKYEVILSEIKLKNNGKLDVIVLSNGKKIMGKILERGMMYKIQTPNGIVSFSKDEIESQTIIK